jgi:Mrp family chromosome partitioning ATPase
MGMSRYELQRWYAIRAYEEIRMSRHFEVLQRVEPGHPLKTGLASSVRPNPIVMSKALNGEDVRVQVQISRFVQQVFLSADDSPKVLAFYEPGPEGESSDICARTARLLAAHVKDEVCAVDFQLECPSLHKRFGVANTKGITDTVRTGQPARSVAAPCDIPNLWVLPTGDSVVGLPPCTVAVPAIMEELRSYFGFVVVNAPLGRRSAEGLAIGILADAAVLVIKANHTTRYGARKAKEFLEAANVRVLGALLTQNNSAIPEIISRSF